MKMKFLLLPVLVAAIVAAASCKKTECPNQPAEPLPGGLHYFYVQNNLDIALEFLGPWSDGPGDTDLPEKFTINRYRYVLLPPNSKTLVKVFQSPENTEPINCLYYQSIIEFNGSCYIAPYDTEDLRSYDIWENKYWKYTRTGEWRADYLFTVNSIIW